MLRRKPGRPRKTSIRAKPVRARKVKGGCNGDITCKPCMKKKCGGRRKIRGGGDETTLANCGLCNEDFQECERWNNANKDRQCDLRLLRARQASRELGEFVPPLPIIPVAPEVPRRPTMSERSKKAAATQPREGNRFGIRPMAHLPREYEAPEDIYEPHPTQPHEGLLEGHLDELVTMVEGYNKSIKTHEIPREEEPYWFNMMLEHLTKAELTAPSRSSKAVINRLIKILHPPTPSHLPPAPPVEESHENRRTSPSPPPPSLPVTVMPTRRKFRPVTNDMSTAQQKDIYTEKLEEQGQYLESLPNGAERDAEISKYRRISHKLDRVLDRIARERKGTPKEFEEPFMLPKVLKSREGRIEKYREEATHLSDTLSELQPGTKKYEKVARRYEAVSNKWLAERDRNRNAETVERGRLVSAHGRMKSDERIRLYEDQKLQILNDLKAANTFSRRQNLLNKYEDLQEEIEDILAQPPPRPPKTRAVVQPTQYPVVSVPSAISENPYSYKPKPAAIFIGQYTQRPKAGVDAYNWNPKLLAPPFTFGRTDYKNFPRYVLGGPKQPPIPVDYFETPTKVVKPRAISKDITKALKQLKVKPPKKPKKKKAKKAKKAKKPYLS